MDAIISWLRKVVLPYDLPDRVIEDVEELLKTAPYMRVKTDFFVFEDHSRQLLICVYGSVPIVYQSHQYYIPVKLWLPHAYPRAPPYVFAEATDDMIVRESKITKEDGMIQIPFLKNWTANKTFNLAALYSLLGPAFSQQPPLFTKLRKAPVNRYSPKISSYEDNRELLLNEARSIPNSAIDIPASSSYVTREAPENHWKVQNFNNTAYSRGLSSSSSLQDISAASYASVPFTQSREISANMMIDPTPRIMQRLQKALEFRKNELRHLNQTKGELFLSRESIGKQMMELERKNTLAGDMVTTNLTHLEEIKRWVAAYNGSDDIFDKKYITTSNLLHQELYECAATDAAISDVLKHLYETVQGGEAMNNFLNMVSKLASEQFRHRIKATKMRQTTEIDDFVQ